jgi:hypothetical protein
VSSDLNDADFQGTDHPFFPPLKPGQKVWASVEDNKVAINGLSDDADAVGVYGQNAIDILGLGTVSI